MAQKNITNNFTQEAIPNQYSLIMSEDISSVQSLMNPVNMYAFFENYKAGNYNYI